MNKYNFFLFSGIVFSLACLLHLFRVLLQWDLTLGGYLIPVWGSVVGVLITGTLAWQAFRFARKK